MKGVVIVVLLIALFLCKDLQIAYIVMGAYMLSIILFLTWVFKRKNEFPN